MSRKNRNRNRRPTSTGLPGDDEGPEADGAAAASEESPDAGATDAGAKVAADAPVNTVAADATTSPPTRKRTIADAPVTRVPGRVTDAEVNALPEPPPERGSSRVRVAAPALDRLARKPGDVGSIAAVREGVTEVVLKPVPRAATALSILIAATGLVYMGLSVAPMLTGFDDTSRPPFDLLAAFYGISLWLLAIGVARTRAWLTWVVMSVAIMAILALSPDSIRSSFKPWEQNQELEDLKHQNEALKKRLASEQAEKLQARQMLIDVLPDAMRYAELRDLDKDGVLLDFFQKHGVVLESAERTAVLEMEKLLRQEAIEANVKPDRLMSWLIARMEELSADRQQLLDMLHLMTLYAARNGGIWTTSSTQEATFTGRPELLQRFRDLLVEKDPLRDWE